MTITSWTRVESVESVETRAVPWLGPVIEVADPRWFELPRAQRYEMCDLVDAHGESPHSTFRVEYDLCDCPLLRITRYKAGPDGRWHHDPVTKVIDCEVVERALRTPLPAWWQPTAGVRS